MAKVRLLPASVEDLERLVGFLRESDPAAAKATAAVIFEGLRVLSVHPLVGRPLDGRRRELVIFRGRTGYLAQYTYRAESDEALVLAIRHQREMEE